MAKLDTAAATCDARFTVHDAPDYRKVGLFDNQIRRDYR